VIAIGTTRKPTQRIRSFIKELHNVIPGSLRLTRGKQGFVEFCESAHALGATRLLLVGAFHGNPGRIGFLNYSGDAWEFFPPTIIIKSAQLLRECLNSPPRRIKTLVVLPDTSYDNQNATLLAEALNVPCIDRDALSRLQSHTAVLRVGLSQYKAMDFVSADETQPLGPSMKVKHFLTRPMGEQSRW
jgi:rRNA maturation protein Rpf1